MRYLVILVVPFLMQCTYGKRMPPKERFPYLLYHYEARNEEGILTESWHLSPDGSLKGIGGMVKDGRDTLVTETLTIRLIKGEYYYVPKVKTQNKEKEILFKITEITDSSFVAENPEHDFPRKISYMLKSRDYLYVVIDDGNDDVLKKMEYHFIRKLR